MKRKFFMLFIVLLVMITGSAYAANYTLPEKMYNQLSIGSGLKGSFVIKTEGDKFDTPFLNQVTDAEFYIRGIKSGNDLHYYLFQKGDDDQQTAVNELYRKDGIFYFRSDMVQGTILAFPTISQYLDMLFPAEGENASSSGFVSKLISMSSEEKEEKWDPVLNRYQKELEMWLAEFTVQADSVKLDNGLSALDFSYDIPMSKVNEEIVHLFGEFAEDAELSSLLKNIMTEQEKDLYLNGNLLYYYLEALNSLNINHSVRMSKRVSAMGELLRFKIDLPLDERITGYESVSLEMVDHLTVYTLTGSKKVILLALPETESFRQTSYNLSVWYACIQTGEDNDSEQHNVAFRADILKTNEAHNDDNEMSHETNHYLITVEQDTKYLPENTDLSRLPEAEQVKIDIDLHYSSKFAQNSATTVDIKAEIAEGDSFLQLDGKVKTAAPWLFMPFEVIDPVQTGTDTAAVLDPYMTDWISNAASMIRHEDTEKDIAPAETQTEEQPSEQQETENQNHDDEQDPQAETAPLDETDRE